MRDPSHRQTQKAYRHKIFPRENTQALRAFRRGGGGAAWDNDFTQRTHNARQVDAAHRVHLINKGLSDISTRLTRLLTFAIIRSKYAHMHQVNEMEVRLQMESH